MQKLRFSGHETFVCKQLWPKKGFDFRTKGKMFSDEDAILELGVGKNMVLSIRYWMKALGLIDENEKLSEVSSIILNEDGFDPFMEDIGTIWFLHFHLVSSNYASLFNLAFNDFFKGKTEFTKQGLHNFIKRIATQSNGNTYNEKTVSNDINIFLRTYLQPGHETKVSSIEDEYSGLFLDLELVNSIKRKNPEQNIENYFLVERKERKSLPKEILLYAILLNERYSNSISLNELVSGYNSVGNIFLLNREGVYQKIEELLSSYNYLTFSQTAGVPTLVFKDRPKPIDVLSSYYENVHVHTIN